MSDEYFDYREEIRQINREHPLRELVIKEFESRSNGRGRVPRRRSREVALLTRDGRRPAAWQIIGGEIRPRKRRDGVSRPDQLAHEMLDWLPEDERSADRLLEEVRKRQKDI